VASNNEIKARQAAQWDNVAESWSQRDAELEANSRPINEWLCDKAGLAPGIRVLDLASGSGQPALAIANLVGPDGWVVATDVAPRMVEVLADKARESGLSNVEARVMDMDSFESTATRTPCEHQTRPAVPA
jgi:ubiquinone/menaquinone biosynthesis C-methylase UbiE